MRGGYAMLTVAEKIKILMKRRGMTMTELAAATGQTRQNLSNKLARDNFSVSDMQALAEALGCEVSIEFRLPDGTTI